MSGRGQNSVICVEVLFLRGNGDSAVRIVEMLGGWLTKTLFMPTAIPTSVSIATGYSPAPGTKDKNTAATIATLRLVTVSRQALENTEKVC